MFPESGFTNHTGGFHQTHTLKTHQTHTLRSNQTHTLKTHTLKTHTLRFYWSLSQCDDVSKNLTPSSRKPHFWTH